MLCAAVNTAIFIASPIYCSYRSVRQFEAELQSIRDNLPAVASPDDAVIVGSDSHFLGYRHAAYYLSNYVTVAYPVAHPQIGPRIFVVHHRDTHLLEQLPATTCTRFILFPLPAEGGNYQEYLKKVVAHLPSGDLRIVHSNGHDFVTGPIADLPFLFSDLNRAPEHGVYALRHSASPHVNSRSH